MKNWDKEKHGVSQKNADAAARGVNKPAGQVLKESWQNLKDAFTPGVKANTMKQNERKKTGGGYPGR